MAQVSKEGVNDIQSDYMANNRSGLVSIQEKKEKRVKEQPSSQSLACSIKKRRLLNKTLT